MPEHLLIIDDDTRLAAMLRDYLSANGYGVQTAASATAGLAELARNPADAVVLDVMLPDLDGFEVLKRIRAGSDVPILMLTAKGDETDRIVGLEIGADDYLPKPFNPRELLARLRAILRRRGAPAPSGVLRFGRLEIDPGSRMARLGGQPCDITGHQFDILLALAESAGRILSREQLLDRVKGIEADAFDRSIDVHVSRIRAAIEDDPRHPRRIVTVRGAGYVMARRQDDEG
ncbi:DNA-binding response regulator, OmpR family, contains REC and winged-helix (wHTH) domain [Paracoccus thiocyanatus]|uniref:Regulatory protein VirG n=1 Tax=Paracoccus thiocyanatus TaxID=34006 RepID=A0A1N6Y7M1_9RHOB|nr:response regulator transcription factor [Paracoccus thiocyanatus]SIR10593.1 DNA-binding response regulator, OmpR family, contains REC and winged-helix (wHTH) domain [Paracoccus thiocyanatus]